MIKRTRIFARDLWQLLRPYWQSEERAACLLLIANILLTLGLVYMNVQFNSWYNLFYDALQNKEVAAFYQQIWRFCMLAAIYIVVAVYRVYLNPMLRIRWRRWLTSQYLGQWLGEQSYYLMKLNQSGTDNPDQTRS